jgi:pyrroline-5-carboxylate reductase
MRYELGFLGAGNMAEAIARAAVRCRVLGAVDMVASDPSPDRRRVFTSLGVTTTEDNVAVIQQAKQVLLAVKPQTMPQVAADLGKHGSPDQVIVTIMAGVTTRKLAGAIRAAAAGRGEEPRIVRVMPNTPLQVGLGMSGVAVGVGTQPGDEALTMKLFGAAGKAVRVEEAALDAVTAVSGSGPAYVFYLAEAMEQAAQDLGLGEHARVIVQQTILGAAQLMASSGEAPAELRRKVTSPGGTTEAAIRTMAEQRVAEAIVRAIQAAEKRSKELGA